MSLSVLRIRYDYETKTGDMVAIFDEHLFEEKALTFASRYHLREVIALFATIDPNVKVVDWYDFLAPLTCRYRRKKDGTWRVSGIQSYEDFDWDKVPATVPVEAPTVVH